MEKSDDYFHNITVPCISKNQAIELLTAGLVRYIYYFSMENEPDNYLYNELTNVLDSWCEHDNIRGDNFFDNFFAENDPVLETIISNAINKAINNR